MPRTKFNYVLNISYHVNPSMVVTTPIIPPTGKAIVSLLFSNMFPDGICRLTNKDISALVDRSVSKISEAISALKKIGIIKVEYKEDKKGRQRSFYLARDWPRAVLAEEKRKGVYNRPTSPFREVDYTYYTPYNTHNIRARESAARSPSIEYFFDKIDPKFLKSKKFKLTWKDWCLYRKQKKRPITKFSAKRQSNFLSQYTTKQAIQIIDRSINNSWTGLFEPEEKNSPSPKKTLPRYGKKLFAFCDLEISQTESRKIMDAYNMAISFLKHSYEQTSLTRIGKTELHNFTAFVTEYIRFVKTQSWISNYSLGLFKNKTILSKFRQHLRDNLMIM